MMAKIMEKTTVVAEIKKLPLQSPLIRGMAQEIRVQRQQMPVMPRPVTRHRLSFICCWRLPVWVVSVL